MNNGKQRAAAPEGYRTHDAHSPRGTHAGAPQETRTPVTNERQTRNFGEGIF